MLRTKGNPSNSTNIKVKGTMKVDHGLSLVDLKGSKAAPKTWQIPINKVLEFPVVEKLRLAMTLIYRFDDGYERKIPIYADAAGGGYYSPEGFNNSSAGLVAKVIDDAKGLVGLCDSPQALRGFPWGCETASEAKEIITRNVDKLLPRIAAKYAVGEDGTAMRKVVAPVWLVQITPKQAWAALEESDLATAHDYARAFDPQDRDGVKAYISYIRSALGYQPAECSFFECEVVSHFEGATPDNAYKLFVQKLVGELRAALINEPIPQNIAAQLDALTTISAKPEGAEAEEIAAKLEVIDAFAKSMRANMWTDRYTGISLVEIARVRALILAGHTPIYDHESSAEKPGYVFRF
jgi:hypothetical protein